MKVIKVMALVIVAYFVAVAALGATVSYLQPTMPGLLTLTTTDAQGRTYDRLLGRFEVDGTLYLVSNNWLSRWYDRTLANPEVAVTMDGRRQAFNAVQPDEKEHLSLGETYPMPLWMKVLAGFPPRRFLRLERVDAADVDVKDSPQALRSDQ